MPKQRYRVLRPEKHYSHNIVMADTPEEALRLVRSCEDGEEEYLEYSDTLDEGWSVELAP